MKQITKNTILRQGNKVFQPIESDGIIYWVDKPLDRDGCIVPGSIVALTKPKFTDTPIINENSISWYMDRIAANYVDRTFSVNPNQINTFERLHKKTFIDGYNSNPNQYTIEDLKKAMDYMYRVGLEDNNNMADSYEKSWNEIIEKINSISEIIVDSDFNILSYES